MSVHAATVRTPMGGLTLLADDDVVVAAGFAEAAQLHVRLPAAAQLVLVRDLGFITAAVRSYLHGELAAIDDLPVRQPGDEFLLAAWGAMRRIPAGATVTYGQLAAMAGKPHAIRAAGTACGSNLLAVVVPCHRVVRMGGDLGGYRYGLPTKQWLLRHEDAQRPVRMRR